MRKTLLIFGLILLFVSLIFASSSKTSLVNRDWKTVDTVADKWEIQSYFSRGTNITLDIRWMVPTDFTDFTSFNATITYIAPSQSETKFRVLFTLVDNPPLEFLTPGNERFPIQVTAISLTTVNSDSLIVANPVKEIGGTVQENGAYTARIEKEEIFWLPIPPSALIFLREVVETQYPYTSLLPVGAVGGALSILCIIFSTLPPRKPKSKATRRLHRKK